MTPTPPKYPHACGERSRTGAQTIEALAREVLALREENAALKEALVFTWHNTRSPEIERYILEHFPAIARDQS